MLPGNMYLAENLTFQIHGLRQFIYIHIYTENMRSQNSVGFPNNILLIEMLLKNQIFYVKLCLTQLP